VLNQVLTFRKTTQRYGFVSYDQKAFLAAVDGYQVGHEFSRHGESRPIRIALLFFSVVVTVRDALLLAQQRAPLT